LQGSANVIIKGVREGLLFILDDDVPFAQLLSELLGRINAQPNFFKGAAVTINAGRRIIDAPDFHVLYRMLTRNEMKVQSVVSMSAQTRMVVEGYGVASRPPSFAAGDAGVHVGLKDRGGSTASFGEAAAEGAISDAATGLFLRCNLRPGQSVRYAGDVCVLGDVETGAEIVADGDVIIWGALRGLVHAGVGGDDEAVVCALQLTPTQLSIAGATSRFPSGATPERQASTPEIARLEWGRIVVEAWHSKSDE
jgi:septum site-determining protein MinC